MKNIKKIFLALLLIVGISRINAKEYTYSEWSALYPSGVDELFIQSEVRYKWYKFENNRIIYTDEYFTEYEGYMKDEASAKTFYRYITDEIIIVGNNNKIITDESYCDKNFCFIVKSTEPTMVDLSEKEDNLYEDDVMYEYTPEVVPMTSDPIIYSFGIIIIAIIGISYYIIRKRKKEYFE